MGGRRRRGAPLAVQAWARDRLWAWAARCLAAESLLALRRGSVLDCFIGISGCTIPPESRLHVPPGRRRASLQREEHRAVRASVPAAGGDLRVCSLGWGPGTCDPREGADTWAGAQRGGLHLAQPVRHLWVTGPCCTFPPPIKERQVVLCWKHFNAPEQQVQSSSLCNLFNRKMGRLACGAGACLADVARIWIGNKLQ